MSDILTNALDLDNIPKCVMDDIGMAIAGEDPKMVVAAMNSYLARFAAPILVEKVYRCLKCGCDLSGLLGTFQWGMVNGEGTCTNCDWPCRAHHYPKDADGDGIFDGALEVILQYHPTHVTHKDQAK